MSEALPPDVHVMSMFPDRIGNHSQGEEDGVVIRLVNLGAALRTVDLRALRRSRRGIVVVPTSFRELSLTTHSNAADLVEATRERGRLEASARDCARDDWFADPLARAAMRKKGSAAQNSAEEGVFISVDIHDESRGVPFFSNYARLTCVLWIFFFIEEY